MKCVISKELIHKVLNVIHKFYRCLERNRTDSFVEEVLLFGRLLPDEATTTTKKKIIIIIIIINNFFFTTTSATM